MADLIARHLVGRDLEPFGQAERPGFKKYMRMLGMEAPCRQSVTKAFDSLCLEVKAAVKKKIDAAKAQNLRFTVTSDAWKSKGKNEFITIVCSLTGWTWSG